MFEVLFKNLTIKKTVLRNRIVLPAMNTNFADADGSVNERFIRYYVERGKGGAGLIIVSSAYIDPRARKRIGSLLLHDDSFIPKLQRFTNAVHSTGARVLQQLNHNGRLLSSSKELQTAASSGSVGPSAVPHLLSGELPRALTLPEIEELIEKFGKAAHRAQLAGFDGVEIHGSHGYLVNQFFSIYSNRRDDEYGGSLENRIRFPLEVYRRIREQTDNDFIISYRLNVHEFAPVETPFSDVISLARRLEAEGVDLIHASAGNSETPASLLKMIPPGSEPPACYADLAAAIKKNVQIPVIAVGRITTPQIAENILKEGKADLVATGRALIADPYWPEKAQKGISESIRRCTGCNQGCMERLITEKEITCLYNPEVGREGELRPLVQKKRVWVIGGGPGGMEAAVIAASRGHEIELFEKENELGGQGLLAAAAPGKEEFKAVTDYLLYELERLKISIHLNEEMTPDRILRNQPDVVILATGSNPLIPDIPGINLKNVVTARDVLGGRQVGENVVVVGGGLVGLETALFLSREGKNVILIEMTGKIGGDIGTLNLVRLKESLAKTTIDIRCQTRLKRIDPTFVTAHGEAGEYQVSIDTVVLAVGSIPENSLFSALTGKIHQIYNIGDCKTPGKMLDAIREGYDTALRIN
jgi:2,4-dienoyl-CoA reductase-like NADH-dependent reductase (Old Yellow Enzyme family)/thioredoxin reductase